jgi:hypothetical protein
MEKLKSSDSLDGSTNRLSISLHTSPSINSINSSRSIQKSLKATNNIKKTATKQTF